MSRGQVLGGRYRVGEPLGVGSLGRVYEARHTALARAVAVKIIFDEVAVAAGGPRRLLECAKAAARVHHRNLVDVLALGELESTIYVVTERMPGPTLRGVVGHLRWPQVRAVALQIVGALKAAHKRGVLHRGLNTNNCFVLEDPSEPSPAPQIKVADLGLGCPSRANGKLDIERTSPLISNASFAAPELGRGEAPTIQTDIYAFGVVLHHLITGELPFQGATPFLVLAAHADRPVPVARSKAPWVPVAVEAILSRALAKDPRERFESMRELELALTDVPADAEGEDDDEPEPAVERAAAPAARPTLAEPPGPPASAPIAARSARDEAMHAAFETQQADDLTPTSLFDHRALAPYVGAAADDLALRPSPRPPLGSSTFVPPRPAAPVRRAPAIPPPRPPSAWIEPAQRVLVAPAPPPPAAVDGPAVAPDTLVLDLATMPDSPPPEQTAVLTSPSLHGTATAPQIDTVLAAPPRSPTEGESLTRTARSPHPPPLGFTMPPLRAEPLPQSAPALAHRAPRTSRPPDGKAALIIAAAIAIATALIGLASMCSTRGASPPPLTTSSLELRGRSPALRSLLPHPCHDPRPWPPTNATLPPNEIS